MPFPTHAKLASTIAICWLLTTVDWAIAQEPFVSEPVDTVSFSREVLPILADRCFQCHGPDEDHREAQLRLDTREGLQSDLGGHAAVVPGNPALSVLLDRVQSTDADEVMPPPDSSKEALTSAEIDVLRRWIAAGASWGKHWAFEPPVRPRVPDSEVSAIDYLVQKKLRTLRLNLSPPAEPHTLLRRVSLDLTGFPPTVDDWKRFPLDHSPQAFEQAVNRLLESPHFGERMAMWWLDAARYADTDGYQQDATRNNWPWRDWVIQAFNRNLPFDQFTIEQFAGDLLPDATVDQQLATCFHRNHMTNGEGGRLPEESRIDYVIDRVNTSGSVWLGLTLGCAQCHAHKFDPISHEEYYQLFAFFNNIDEDGKAGSAAVPYLEVEPANVQKPLQAAEALVVSRSSQLDRTRREAEREFEIWLLRQLSAVKEGFEGWHPLDASALASAEGTILEQSTNAIVTATGPTPRQDDYRFVGHTSLKSITGFRLEVLPAAEHTGGKLSRGATGEFILTNVKLQLKKRGKSQLIDIPIESAIADVQKDVSGRDYGKIADTLDDDPRNGWTTESHDSTQPHMAVFALENAIELAQDDELIFVLMHRSTDGDANIGKFRLSVSDQCGEAVRSLAPMPLEELASAPVTSPADLPKKLRSKLFEQFLFDHKATRRARENLQSAISQRDRLKKASEKQNVMVLQERKDARDTHVLLRGAWDQKGKLVKPDFPAAILATDIQPTNRLDLAKWIVHPSNPLTARVIVNQLWQLCFGAGLVRTAEDFGLQGEPPTHPELLDWLAVEFVESGWDVKHILRIIVTSETYRQQSHVSAQLLTLDPDNRLLARGARFRLPSWMIRDAALRSSELINLEWGGPPMMPYQPEGIWEEMFMGRFQYQPSQGTAQFRRTIYAFWRRSAAPTFLFDSSQRQVCETRPRLTNTPLHALTLLNDLTIREASRKLADRAFSMETGTENQIQFIVQCILSRSASELELKIFERTFETSLAYYRAHRDEAQALLSFGQPENEIEIAVENICALMNLANLVFNLDEAMTHE